MMKNCFAIAVFSIIIVGCAPAIAHNNIADISVEPLLQTDYMGGCGIAFFSTPPDHKPAIEVFRSDDWRPEGIMRIDGALVHPTLVDFQSHRQLAGKETVGDRYVSKWKEGTTEVTLNYRVTFVCPPNDDACEVTRFEGAMTVKTGQKLRHFPIWGDSGC